MKEEKKSCNRMGHAVIIIFFVLLAGLAVLCTCSGPKVYKVGILCSYSPFADIADAFKSKMTELGYVEGKNITYDMQTKETGPEAEKEVLNKFIADKVDMIFTFPTSASITAEQVTKGTKIPVVFAMANVEGEMTIDSINHPGGNFTGVRFPGPDNIVKHTELLLEIKPRTKTIWVTYDIAYPNTRVMLDALRPATKSKGISLIEAPGKTAKDIQTALDALVKSGDYKKIDAIQLLPEALSLSADGFPIIMNFGNKYKIPVCAGVPPMMAAGVLFCQLPADADMGKMAAGLAEKIFKGTAPGEIPIVTPENYLFLNNKIATALGLTIPDGLLKQAVQVIK
jgi:putative ABC transport system substrate-binding protein